MRCDSEMELLDRPGCDPSLAEKSYRFMRFVNRIGGGTRVVRRFLAQEISRSPLQGPVQILDLGSGTCDIPLAVTRWARRRGYPLEFTCIEHNAQGLELARQALARAQCDTIELTVGDLFTYQPPREYDYAVGSMVLHHFSMQQISRLITHLRGFVRKALLINDLQRCALNYGVCYALTLGRDPIVRHDALLSVRRGFRPDELSAFVATRDAPSAVGTAWFCRVVAVVRFDGGGVG
jgi:hypothetical protein